MPKKRTNPYRIPVSIRDYDLKDLKAEATTKMVLQEWAIILAAIASFSDITTEHLLSYWDQVNNAATQVDDFESAQKWLSRIQDMASCSLPLRRVNLHVKTKADINKLQRHLLSNAKATAFAMIVEAMITQEVMEEEDLKTVIRKSVSMNEEIDEGRISVQDLVDMLQDEYSIRLEILEGRTVLHRTVLEEESSLML